MFFSPRLTALLTNAFCLYLFSLVYQQEAYNKLSEEFASYNYTTPANRMKFSESQRKPLDLMERAVARAHYKLLTITELFHELCLPYKLWEVCLLLLHVSKHEDPELMSRLWRSLIYRYESIIMHITVFSNSVP